MGASTSDRVDEPGAAVRRRPEDDVGAGRWEAEGSPYDDRVWLEIELERSGDQVTVSGRGSRAERAAPRQLPSEQGLEALQSFANKVGRAVRTARELESAVIEQAQALYEAILQGDLRDMLVRLTEASKDEPLLIRLFAWDLSLLAIPWEALCKSNTVEGFWGADPRLVIARGVSSPEPWEPREVRGAVRVLAIAPGTDERALVALEEALGPSIESGEVEWLDPIAGPDINARVLYDKLRRGKNPHVVHFLGHGGVDLAGKPVMRLADDEDGEEVWITAESLARELSAGFYEELRLVILEACEGAKPGAFGSAAEILGKAGADAVVAHLWPVKTDVARACSTELYRMLTASNRANGDIGASVMAARRTLLAERSAEAFSPILYLRGTDSVIFDFRRRAIKPSGKPEVVDSRAKRKALAPALQSLLEKPFTLVLGDLDEDHAPLIHEIKQFMQQNGDPPKDGLSLPALAQRCVFRFGEEVLYGIFQQANAAFEATPLPPMVDALGRLVPPGIHCTLLWEPHIERAIAKWQPDRTIYTIQPCVPVGGKPRVVKRAARTTVWKTEPMPTRFDFDNEIVILRLYGGYSPERHPIYSQPILTEDDHIHGLAAAEGLRPPRWIKELLARPRNQPGLFIGLSIEKWPHRLLLHWLYEKWPAPSDSLAILTPRADPVEPGLWDSGVGLPGSGRISPISEDPDQLASMLTVFATEVGK